MTPFTTWQGAVLHAQGAWMDAWKLNVLPYATSNAFAVALQLLLVLVALTWLASVVTRNFSFTDRLWSITPPVFAWHFALHAYATDGGVWDQRLLLMAVLSTLWGCRLTFNFWRKGGYKLSEEDYRWAVVRQYRYMHWTMFEVLNLVFIAGYQHVLLMLLAVPSYVVYFHRHQELNVVDGVATALFLMLLVLETIADQQQWNFYSKKYELIAHKKPLTGDYKAGFNRSGLFRYSRHPNFFSEMSLWWAFYLFTVAVSEPVFNPSSLGAILLTLLFHGSAPFTEHITATKYPLYKEYQQHVSMLVPWFPSVKSVAHED